MTYLRLGRSGSGLVVIRISHCAHVVRIPRLGYKTLPRRVVHVLWLLAAICGAGNCSDIFAL